MYNVKDYQIVTFGVILALGAILSTAILTGGIIKFQELQSKTISVTGSASENIKSDFAVLNFTYKAKAVSLKEGYREMNENREKIKNFLLKSGFSEKDIEFSPVSSYEVYKHIGSYSTNEVEFYRLDSDVKISSNDISKIETVTDSISKLIENDIEIGYSNVQYLVSNLDELKIKMVGEATKNAKERASSMVKSTGGSIGTMNSAKMGVFQIVPVNSTEVSDYGISDTSSIEKKVVAVVNAQFNVK